MTEDFHFIIDSPQGGFLVAQRSNASVHQRRPIIALAAVWCNAS